MRIGILGAGQVGQGLATGFSKQGHEVRVATRDQESGALNDWLASTSGVELDGFGGVAAWCELALLCTGWGGTDSAIRLADPANLAGKVVIDVTNPIVQVDGGTGLALGHTDSAGEQVQRWLPESWVVKSLNMVPAAYQLNPAFGPESEMFVAGNDAAAKETVAKLLQGFGWAVLDLGGVDKARLMEPLGMLLMTVAMARDRWDLMFQPVFAGAPVDAG